MLALFIPGAIVGFWGAAANGDAVMITGCVFMLASIVSLFVLSRCPHCGKYLGRGGGDYCRYCGKRIDE